MNPVVISTSEQVNVFESRKQNKTENKTKEKKERKKENNKKMTFPCHAISVSPNLSCWPISQIKHSVWLQLPEMLSDFAAYAKSWESAMIKVPHLKSILHYTTDYDLPVANSTSGLEWHTFLLNRCPTFLRQNDI